LPSGELTASEQRFDVEDAAVADDAVADGLPLHPEVSGSDLAVSSSAASDPHFGLGHPVSLIEARDC